MTQAGHFELPPDRQVTMRRAVRIEWLTLAYMVTAAAALYVTLGASQAMRAAFFADLLSIIPPAAFLVAMRFRERPPNRVFPYGHHRSTAIGFLVAALALFGMGAFLLVESASRLMRGEHPSIGTMVLFGHQVWLGWVMIAALLYSGIPPVFIGRAKRPLGRSLHDKVLMADARMNHADWLTAAAAIVGVLGISVGLWWADAAAAIVISLDIAEDGYRFLRVAVSDLMDKAPTAVDGDRLDPLPARVEKALRELPWVADARVRFREEGHVFFGEALVVPSDHRGLVPKIHRALEDLQAMDWRLHDLVIMPVEGFGEGDRPGEEIGAVEEDGGASKEDDGP
jgi:cation diffusion facilitator family transporter